jgi:hypothetical protein
MVMSPRRGYSREEVIRLLQDFYRESGRPPRRTEPDFGKVVTAAKKEFGSWDYALKIAGLQTFKSWHKKETVSGKILTLLNNNPMTLGELRREFMKNENFLKSQTALSITLSTAMQNADEIKSLGPKRSKVYFLKGQEKLAENHLRQAPDLDEKQDFIFCALRNPMTKSEIRNLFPQTESVSCVDRLLQELVSAELVRKIEFVAGRGSKKYNTTELFGKIAAKRFYFRPDCPGELADFIIENISCSRIQEPGFERSLSIHLKRMLPSDVYEVFLRKMVWHGASDKNFKPKSPRLDDYFQ